jgi:hypothetical protein
MKYTREILSLGYLNAVPPHYPLQVFPRIITTLKGAKAHLAENVLEMALTYAKNA